MIDYSHNRDRGGLAALAPELLARFGNGAEQMPPQYLSHCPLHKETELYHLPNLASNLGVKAVLIKDESTRLKISSFKALGAAYVIFRLVHEEAERQLGKTIPPENLLDPEIKPIAARV